jgi:HK97 gp10 family phage protein
MGLSARATFRPRSNLGQFIPAVITPAVTASVQAACELIQTDAQSLCPVDTGALRDSIVVTLDTSGSTIVGRVGPTMDYASYVEYGTGRRGGPAPYAHVLSWPGQKPQPYIRPAFDGAKDAVLDLFRSNLLLAL